MKDYAKIPLTRGEFAIVDKDLEKWLSMWNWHCDGSGYAARQITIDKKGGKWIQQPLGMAHQIIVPELGLIPDHKNGNKLDNRIDNLRACRPWENHVNRANKAGSVSKYKGVSKVGNKWKASITVKGERHYLGLHETEEDAAWIYNQKAIEIHGEFARLNFF